MNGSTKKVDVNIKISGTAGKPERYRNTKIPGGNSYASALLHQNNFSDNNFLII